MAENLTFLLSLSKILIPKGFVAFVSTYISRGNDLSREQKKKKTNALRCNGEVGFR